MLGIFDSGVGGLTVARELRSALPDYNLVYFGDTARTPYGNKSKDTIIKYALENADFLIKKGAKVLIIACNTASAMASEALKEKHPNIPIFEVIAPAILQAETITKNARIGVIGTRATIGSGVYKEGMGKDIVVFSKACPLFVPFIEEGWIKKIELKMIAKKYLNDFKHNNIDTLILGCTHYPIIKDIISAKVGRGVNIIDSANALALEIKLFLSNNKNIDDLLSKGGRLEIYASDTTSQCESIAKKLLGSGINIINC